MDGPTHPDPRIVPAAARPWRRRWLAWWLPTAREVELSRQFASRRWRGLFWVGVLGLGLGLPRVMAEPDRAVRHLGAPVVFLLVGGTAMASWYLRDRHRAAEAADPPLS